MKQYCRYCSQMCCADLNYCGVKDKFFSDKQIKRPNKCKDFEFNEIDAIDPERIYKPRVKKDTDFEQLDLFNE